MTTVATFLEQTRRFPRTCAFRGHADGSWQLHSSATRRLIRHIGADVTHRTNYPRVHATYHIDELIEPARTAGFGIEDGYELSPLQLLTKLQHFGAATGLMDFSWNPLVALWFACRQGEADNRDGKVFLVDLNDPAKFDRVSNERDKQEIDYIFPSTAAADKPLYWEPTVVGAATHRILRQRSVFVIGRPLVPESAVDIVEILAVHKEPIRKELEERFDISTTTLFVDLQGFATANGATSPIRLTVDPRLYLLRGNQQTQQGQHTAAIESYDRCIQLDPDVREPYFLRANAKAASQDYSGAKADYDLALDRGARPYHNIGPNTTIVNDPDLSMILFNRGNVRAEGPEPDYEGAVKDYTDAIKYQVFDTLGAAVFFNRANAKTSLGMFDEAISDYDEAIHLGSQNAQFNKGNLLVKLRRFDEAHRCFADLLQQGRREQHLVINEAAVRGILNRIDGREFRPEYENEGDQSLQVRVNDDSQDLQLFPIVGYIGNIGNFGGNRLPGGKGFAGGSGFVVRVIGDNR